MRRITPYYIPARHRVRHYIIRVYLGARADARRIHIARYERGWHRAHVFRLNLDGSAVVCTSQVMYSRDVRRRGGRGSLSLQTRAR